MIKKADLQKEINIINAEYEWQRLSLHHHSGNKFVIINRSFSLTSPLTIKELNTFLHGYERSCYTVIEKVQALVEFQEKVIVLNNELSAIRRLR